MLENLKDKVEKFCSTKTEIDYKGKHYEVSHKTTGIIAGFTAYLLILTGALFVFDNPLIGITKILYGFVILLPIAYYQMNEAEKESVMKVNTDGSQR